MIEDCHVKGLLCPYSATSCMHCRVPVVCTVILGRPKDALGTAEGLTASHGR